MRIIDYIRKQLVRAKRDELIGMYKLFRTYGTSVAGLFHLRNVLIQHQSVLDRVEFAVISEYLNDRGVVF